MDQKQKIDIEVKAIGAEEAATKVKAVGEAGKKASADFLGFNDSLKKVKTSLTDTAKSFNPVTLATGALTGAIAGLALGGLKDMFMGVINARTALFDLSKSSGLTVEALSGLKKIGAETGVTLETIAELTKKFNAAVASSDKPTSLQAQAFKNLGINLKDQNGKFKDTITLQQEAAKTLNQHADGIEKDSYYMAIWGKQAIENRVYLQKLGEEGKIHGSVTKEQAEKAKQLEMNLRELGKAGNEFKGVLVDALVPWVLKATGGLIDLLKASKDLKSFWKNRDLFGDSSTVLENKLAAEEKEFDRRKKALESMPKVEGKGADDSARQEYVSSTQARLGSLRELIKVTKEREEQIKQEERDKLRRGDKDMTSSATGDSMVTGDGRPTLKGLKTPKDHEDKHKVPDLLREIAAQKEKLSILQGTSEEQALINKFADIYYKKYKPEQVEELKNLELKEMSLKKFNDQWQGIHKINEASAENVQRIKDQIEESKISIDVMKVYGNTQNDVRLAILDRAIAENEARLAQLRAIEGTNDQTEAIAKLIVKIRELNEERTGSRSAKEAEVEETRRQRTFAYGWENAYNKYTDDATNASIKAQNMFGVATNTMSQAMDIFTGASKASFKDLIISMIRDLIRLEMQAQMTSFFKSAGGFGGIFNSIVGAFMPSPFPQGFSNAAGISGGRAAGGDVSAFQRVMVGENGPEILQMGAMPGHVIPNNIVKGMSSGQDNSISIGGIHISITGQEDPQGIALFLEKKLPAIIKRISDSRVANANRPGGINNR